MVGPCDKCLCPERCLDDQSCHRADIEKQLGMEHEDSVDAISPKEFSEFNEDYSEFDEVKGEIGFPSVD